MKLRPLFFVLITFIAIQACRKKVCVSSDCIQAKIEQHKNNPQSYTSQVDEYTFQGRTVYAFIDDPQKITDGGMVIMDGNCNQICFLGGIGGLTTCSGEKFNEKAVFIRTIWKR
jgi:hypothetical protein